MLDTGVQATMTYGRLEISVFASADNAVLPFSM
jgi:hypothetical protein